VDDFREERRARGAAGRQARPDLSLDKSGKKERARQVPTGSSTSHHALSGCCKSSGRMGCLTAKRETLPPARAFSHPGRGHRPCHSATLILGPPGAQSPRSAPAPPPAGAGLRCAWTCRSTGRRSAPEGKRGAFTGPARRGNSFPRIGKAFPAAGDRIAFQHPAKPRSEGG